MLSELFVRLFVDVQVDSKSFIALTIRQCFDAVGWAAGRASGM